MKQVKKLRVLIFCMSLILLFSACSTGNQNKITNSSTSSKEVAESSSRQVETAGTETKTAEQETETEALADSLNEIRIIGLAGPTGMGFAKLLADSEADSTLTHYTMNLAAAPDHLIAAATKNEADIIAMPSNLASVLWNKTDGEFQVLAINTLGVLNIVEKGENIQSIADLKGKTIIAAGKGAAPEYAFNYLLNENGLNPKTDVQIEWKSEHQEVVAALASTDQTIGLLPQPFVTVALNKVEGLRIAIDLNTAWQDLNNGSEFVMGVVVANKNFIAEHSAMITKFLADYQASVYFVNQQPVAAAELIEKYKILENAKIAETAIPNCHITCITGEEMSKALDGYLEVLYHANPQAVGGTMPDETLYFKK